MYLKRCDKGFVSTRPFFDLPSLLYEPEFTESAVRQEYTPITPIG